MGFFDYYGMVCCYCRHASDLHVTYIDQVQQDKYKLGTCGYINCPCQGGCSVRESD